MTSSIRFLFVALVLFFSALSSGAQSPDFIYADVVMKSGETVSGILKWHDGQVLWSDVLQASKNNTSLLKYLNPGQLDKLSNQDTDKSLDWKFMSLWKDKLPQRQSEVLCRFGDITSIHITGETDAQIYYRNKAKSRVTIRGQDGEPVRRIDVYGASGRTIEWNKISRINFRTGDYNALGWKRQPLYGTVYTMSGPVTGYIRWDQSKFLTSQTLYGKNEEVIAGIKFRDIKKIAKKDQGALVSFNSGKQVFLHSTGDVSAASRGIVVTNRDWGRAVIEWAAFKSVVFSDPPESAGYDAFLTPRRIYATVRTAQGRIFKGNCTFDLDEEWNFEMLEGNNNRIQYQIPFLNISALTPLNEEQSRVALKNGKSYVLSGNNDVSAKNWGVIIWLANSKYQYIPWSDITDISFR